ncbi:MAG: hypothetical protein EWM45_15340 [Rhodopseudomonas palustris]|nr:MAG: hypothetical protein EWM45_15340 [Rhodopseudomonas palustris]
MKLFAVDVFTPNDFPTFTYVTRQGPDLEQRLSDALATPKIVVSISGPSKSGKTVLIEKTVGKDNMIAVSGAEVRSGTDLWARVFAWMGGPATVASQSSSQTAHRSGGEAGAKGGIPFLADASGKLSYDQTRTSADTRTETETVDGLGAIVKEIGNSEFVVLLDDFHYIPKEAQGEVAKQIKAAAERGIRICVATVPHRADDVVRTNHELRGRLAQIDTMFWTSTELQQIAEVGFPKLGIDLPPHQAARLAKEACGSPQLMQRICLDVCFAFNVRKERSDLLKVELDPARLQSILEQSSTHADFGAMVANMHQGPKTRGTERRLHQLIDGTEGDVYRVVLLALAYGSPDMSLPYPALMQRIETVCKGDTPSASSIVQACRQIDMIAKRVAPTERVVEWDDHDLTGTLTVVNPYFLFYLRASRKLEALGARPSDQDELPLPLD